MELVAPDANSWQDMIKTFFIIFENASIIPVM